MEDHGIVAVVRKNERFLLLEDSRELMLGRWAPPHGRCEKTDTSEERCVVREVEEETKLDVKPIRKLWTTEADTKVKTVSFWLVEVLGGDIQLDDESSSYGWFTLDDVLALKLYPGTKRFFELVKRGEIQV